MTDELRQIAYNEGCQAFADNVNLMDNPYNGVSHTLKVFWSHGWWSMFYDEN
jgi:hypothetical protein